MRKFSFYILLLFASATACAQTDTTYVINRNSVDARFTFKKFSNVAELRNHIPPSFPIYSMSKNQYIRVRELLYHYVSMENQYEGLRTDYHAKDSIFRIKELTLTDAYQKQEARAKNFEESYNKLLSINDTMDKDLKKCEELAQGEHRKKNKKTVVVGILAAAAGFLIGAVAL
jgi:hypothetical protein